MPVLSGIYYGGQMPKRGGGVARDKKQQDMVSKSRAGVAREFLSKAKPRIYFQQFEGGAERRFNTVPT